MLSAILQMVDDGASSAANTISGGHLSTTVLLAEDFEPFRQMLLTFLQKKQTLRVAAAVADGLHAVERAGELHPDLILLDICLPNLDGIGAARRIRALSPESKIIFVSQHNSDAVVQECFAAGAIGYVVKWDVGSQLLTAIDAALRGERFVSSSIGCSTTGSVEQTAPSDSRPT